MSIDLNERARGFLEGLGFTCEPEPNWVTRGRKPDFFCTGPLDLWTEVKSLAPPGESERVSLVSEYLVQHQDRVGAGGRAFAYIADRATEKHAKAALNLTNHAFKSFDLSPFEELVVVVPESPRLSGQMHAEYMTQKGRTLLVTYGAESSQYAYPYSARPKPHHQKVTLSGPSGADVIWLHRIARPDQFLIALQIDDFDSDLFQIAMIGRPGIGRALDTSSPIRNAIQDANGQLKNGLRYREAPTALFLYQNGLLVPDDIGVLAALFGDLNYTFTPGKFGEGRIQFGNNGALRGQHSSMSAIVYFRNEGIPLTIHNPWASRVLPKGLFGYREYVPLGDDTLMLVE